MADPTLSSIQFIPSSNGSITASFENSINYSYEFKWWETNGTGTYLYDTEISFQATPNSGFKFLRWTGDTQFIDAERAKVDLTVPSQDLSLEAEFTPIRLTIETSVVGSGTVSSGGTYDMGESVSLTATPSGIDTTAPVVIN